MKHAAVLFANGFEEVEAISIVDVLRRANIQTIMVGIDEMLEMGAHQIAIHMNQLIDELDADHLDALILPGGMPGAKNLAECPQVQGLLQKMDGLQKTIGAICAAPIALQAAGILRGRTVTCYPGVESQLTDAKHSDAMVETDGNLITGRGPGAALDFALALVARLVDQKTADSLREGMLIGL